MPLELTNAQKWELIKDETYILLLGRTERIDTEVILEANRYFFLVGCFSSKIKPRWWLGCRAVVKTPVMAISGFKNNPGVFRRKCGLGELTLIEVPNYLTLPAALSLTIPYWHQELSLKVWQYNGSGLEPQNGGNVFFVVLAGAIYQPHPTEPDLVLSTLTASTGLKNHGFVVIGLYELQTQNEVSRPVVNYIGIDEIECIFEGINPVENNQIQVAIAIA